jgi:hypothetical protein
MALRVWLRRSSPEDVDAHWAIALYERCERYKILPSPGGAYDQDEYLIAMMEQAAGVSALFDIDAQRLISNQKWLDLHTKLMTDSAALVALINQREKDNGNEKP